MLKAIVEFSLRHRGVIIALACLVMAYGAYISSRSKLDVFPEFAPAQVIVQAEAPGLSPEEVELLITQPVENAVNGAGDLESLRSQSIQGLSVVTATFRENVDVHRARQSVAERLAEISEEMPAGAQRPTMLPLASAMDWVLMIGLTSEKRSSMDLRTFADWTLRPRLLAVPGVAKTTVYGGEVKQLQVQIRPDRLTAFNVSRQDVVQAARLATGVRGAGFIDAGGQRITLQSLGQSLTPEQLREAVVSFRGTEAIRLRDVANVVIGAEPKIGDSAIRGKPGIIMIVSSQYGSNTMEVTHGIERALAEMRSTIEAEGITLHPAIFRPASFIAKGIHNVRTALLVGGILVAVVLGLFLFNLRTALISITAIPLSLFTAIVVLNARGISLNTLTLGGLAIAIGEVVDDAIIDVENIVRRLRENRSSASPRPVYRVVLDASLEVRGAVIYATFVVVLVFLPVILMTGIQGKLFAPLGWAYVFAIIASLVVALTVTPAMSLWLIAGHSRVRGAPPLASFVKARYAGLLIWVTARPRAVIAAVIALVVFALALVPFIGGEFLPEFQEGHYIVHMDAAPGTSLQESLSLGRAVTSALMKSPHVRIVSQRVGRAEQGEDIFGTHSSEFDVDLKPFDETEGEVVQAEIRQIVSTFPSAAFAIKGFLSERIEEILSGAKAQVVIGVFGDDLDTIDQKANQVVAVLSSIQGAVDAQVMLPSGVPKLVLRLQHEKLRQLGFRPVEVMEAIETAYHGTAVAQTYDKNRVFDVAVVLDPALCQDPAAVGELTVTSFNGTRARLRELTDIYLGSGRYAVTHEGARRQRTVTCNVAGRDVASFVAEAKQKISKDVSFPADTYPVFSGEAEQRTRATNEILVHSAVAGVCIFLLLGIAFGSAHNLLLVLVNLPFALVGGIIAAFVTGVGMSIGTLVGFVTLFGISTRNTIMLISHYRHLVHHEGAEWGPETVLRGASERLLPVLMTALVTGIALLPIAIGAEQAGKEIEGPMAIVIVGGLLTSTLLTLLVLPTLALRFARFRSESRADMEENGGSVS